jgi:hypothetical protein
MDWLGKLLETVVGGLPSAATALCPDYLKKKWLERLADQNPFKTISANHDLIRATRLAWIEAAQDMLKAAVNSANPSERKDVVTVNRLVSDKLKKIRDDALDWRPEAGNSPIDVHVQAVINGVPELVAPGEHAGIGAPVTAGFVEVLSKLSGWPAYEVPSIFDRLASDGLSTHGGGRRRTFGELVFAAFAEIIKDPKKYPQAREAFYIAMDKLGRDIGQATLGAVQGLDTKLDALTAGLDGLQVLRDGAIRYLDLLPGIASSARHIEQTTTQTRRLVEEQALMLADAIERLEEIWKEVVRELELVTGFNVLSANQVARLPTSLVIADYGVVPYDDSVGQKASLMAWALDPKTSCSGRIYTARGGSGKTRLALEAISELASIHGWKAGLLPHDALTANSGHAGDADALLDRFFRNRGQSGVLLAIDYAESRSAEIARIARAVLRAKDGGPIRILLLARQAANWWRELRGTSREVELVFDKEPNSILAADLPPERRARFVQATASAFSARLSALQPEHDSLAAKSWEISKSIATRLESERSASPLSLVFEAFLLARGIRGTQSPLIEMAREERTHWRRALGATAPDERHIPNSLVHAIARCASVLTLIQGSHTTNDVDLERTLGKVIEASLAFEGVPGSNDLARAEHLRLVRSATSQVYRSAITGSETLQPVKPDLLGEYIVAEQLASVPSLLASTIDVFPEFALLALTICQRALEADDSSVMHTGISSALMVALPNRITPRIAADIFRLCGRSQGKFLAVIEELVPSFSKADLGNLVNGNVYGGGLLSRLLASCTNRLRSISLPIRSGRSSMANVDALTKMAISLHLEGRHDKALVTNRDAEKLLNELEGEVSQIEFDLSRSAIFANDATFTAATSDYASAVKFALRAAECVRPHFDQGSELAAMQLVTLQSNIAVFQRKLGDENEARQNSAAAAQLALGVWKARRSLDARSLMLIATVALNHGSSLEEGSPSEAREFLLEAWAAAQELEDLEPSIHADLLKRAAISLGGFLYRQGNKNEARDVFVESTRKFRSLSRSHPKKYHDDFMRLAASALRCANESGATADELDALAQEFEVSRTDKEITDVSIQAQTLYAEYWDRVQRLASAPSAASVQELEDAKRTLNEFIKAHPNDFVVKRIQKASLTLNQSEEAAADDPARLQILSLVDSAEKEARLFRRSGLEADRMRGVAAVQEIEELLANQQDIEPFIGVRRLLPHLRGLLAPTAPVEDKADELEAAVTRQREIVGAAHDSARDELASALFDLANHLGFRHDLAAAHQANDEALAIFMQLTLNGEERYRAYVAAALELRAEFLISEQRPVQAVRALLDGAHALRPLAAEFPEAIMPQFRVLMQKYFRAAAEAGLSAITVRETLATLGALEGDPEEEPESVKFHGQWAKAHNEGRYEDAKQSYKLMVGALDRSITDPTLDPLRQNIRDSVSKISSPRYEPMPQTTDRRQ